MWTSAKEGAMAKPTLFLLLESRHNANEEGDWQPWIFCKGSMLQYQDHICNSVCLQHAALVLPTAWPTPES